MSEGLQYSRCVMQGKISPSTARSTENIKSEETGQRLIDLAWVAGIIDGEGHLRYTTSPAIVVESVSKSMVDKCCEIANGSVHEVSRKTSTGKTVYRWQVSGTKAKNLCRELIPYLSTKKFQANILEAIMNYPAKSDMRKTLKDMLNGQREILN